MPKLPLLYIICLLFAFGSAKAQKMSIGGNVHDTVAKAPLSLAVVMAVRIKDSLLLAHTRTNEQGIFTLSAPIDTVQVIITHPKFGEQSYYVFGSTNNAEFNFGKIILPPKSHDLQEIVIYAYKDPVYYKGDTLVYTADSFKVRPNATVEDLLKKLPGIKVDDKGKITSQGKKIEQVLVDGDEFFGKDPTIATKNLNANSVESIQVYEKQNEDAADGSGEETIKVMNLQLKEESKKGYLGKISGASDFQNFHEGQILLNKFTSTQKLSVITMGSNTPNSTINWGDMYTYGSGEIMIYDEDSDNDFTWESSSGTTGIPRSLTGGIYYTDKISKKTKILSNYNYNNNSVTSISESRSQYFLEDTTYTSENKSRSQQLSQSHTVNFTVEHKLDSLTDLKIAPSFTFKSANMENFAITDYIDSEDTLSRKTDIFNSNTSKNYDLNTFINLKRKFKKKDRRLNVDYKNTITNNSSDGLLVSNNTYFNNLLLPNDSTDQQKQNVTESMTNNATVTFIEPLSKKMKLAFSYNFNLNQNNKKKETFNAANGEYLLKDSLFTNNFENQRMTNLLGLKFIYELKKYKITVGSKFRQVAIDNNNLITGQTIAQKVNNILPYARFRYNFSDTKEFSIHYNSNSSQPSIEQLQPVQDNTNPNQISRGNPNLLPTFQNSIWLSYYEYKGLSGDYYSIGGSYNNTLNAFSNSIEYDSIGRTITTTINVNENYNYDAYANITHTFFDKLTLASGLEYDYSHYSNFINHTKNSTTTSNISPNMEIRLNLDTLELRAEYEYNYTTPNSTISAANNKPYSAHKLSGSLYLRLPFKTTLNSNFNYTINTQRTQGYNINYFIWNASLEKTLLKSENLIVAINANDILNQNISAQRIVQDNVITDDKTKIIGRYLLLRVTYKFNSNKTKTDELF